jgi:hypothetical protein
MGKMQGFWFSMYGLPDEEVGKETGPKGTVVWVVVYGFAVFGLWEKCRGFGFLCMGCLVKRLGRKRGRRVLCMGCCVWVCNVWFMGQMQGFWFSMYGLPGEDVGKETGPKGAFGLRKEW